jgi:hypothetical protein
MITIDIPKGSNADGEFLSWTIVGLYLAYTKIQHALKWYGNDGNLGAYLVVNLCLFEMWVLN